MIMDFVEYLVVMGFSAFKVMFGVASAVGFDMTFFEVFLTVAFGGMFGIVLYAFLGNELRSWIQKRRRRLGKTLRAGQIRRLRFVIRIWKRFGIIGIAFLTPPFLTPPFGTLIAVAFGERVSRIILFFGASMVAWSLVFAFFGQKISELIQP